MISLILSVLVISQTSLTEGENALNQMANRYSSANGIQWTIHSQTYSQIFEETTLTSLQFYFNQPDTFYYSSDSEQVLGIADTIWILSKVHKQIQKKLNDSYLMPTDFIITWNRRYMLENYAANGNLEDFELVGKVEDISPARVKITIDNQERIREISYKDISGDDVTLMITKEKLRRFGNINLFYAHLPKGYKLIDLVE